MAVNLMLALRAVQAGLAVLILGLSASVINDFTSEGFSSPDEVNFFLFCSIWTFLVLAYICFAPNFAPAFHNQYGVLGAEVISCIFWFSAWVANAAWIAPWKSCINNSTCGTAKAAVAFGAFEWLAFMISAFLVIRAFLQTRRGEGAATAGTEMPATSGTDKISSANNQSTSSGNPVEQHKEGDVENQSELDGVRIVRIPSPEEYGGREVV